MVCIDLAGSVVAGATTVVVVGVVVVLVVDVEVVVKITVVIGAFEDDVAIVGACVAGLVVGGAVVGGVVVLVGDPAAASLHAVINNSPATTKLDNLPRRPTMRGDHRERHRAVRLTMVTIHITISIDMDSDQESATVVAERLKDIVWKEAYEHMQLPASTATAYPEVS